MVATGKAAALGTFRACVIARALILPYPILGYPVPPHLRNVAPVLKQWLWPPWPH
jgi:hypothetical protein